MSKLIFAAGLATFLFASYHASIAQAEPTACKGKVEADCTTFEVFEGIKACIWMKERMTASGKTVKAHCRGSNKSVPADAKRKDVASTPSQTN